MDDLNIRCFLTPGYVPIDPGDSRLRRYPQLDWWEAETTVEGGDIPEDIGRAMAGVDTGQHRHGTALPGNSRPQQWIDIIGVEERSGIERTGDAGPTLHKLPTGQSPG
jgi:hypothetical protein